MPPFNIVLPLAVLSLVWAWRRQRPISRRIWQPVHWLVLGHFFFFVAPIAIGTLYPAEGSSYGGSARAIHHGAEAALNVLLYGSLVSCGLWIWRIEGVPLVCGQSDGRHRMSDFWFAIHRIDVRQRRLAVNEE